MPDRNITLRDLEHVQQEVFRLLVWVANARPGAQIRVTKRSKTLALQKIESEETIRIDD